MYCEILPETLKTHRDRLRWTQDKLAYEAGVNRQTIIKKEGSGPKRTRLPVAENIARALGVKVAELARPIEEEAFFLDVDVFAHLREALAERDFYHVQKFLEYIQFNLAEALDLAQLELSPDWQKKALEGPRPSLPSVSRGSLSNRYATVGEDDLHYFLAAWHNQFDENRVNPDMVLRSSKFLEFHAAVKKLPVVEAGRINHFSFKAFLRRYSGTKVRNFELRRFPDLNAELWNVVRLSP